MAYPSCRRCYRSADRRRSRFASGAGQERCAAQRPLPQVFFGKLKNTHGDYLTLEGAYYTRKQDVPEDATEEQKAAVSNNVSLARVGDEVYGPESTIRIKAEQVLFWQDLKSDSKVAKAIDDAK